MARIVYAHPHHSRHDFHIYTDLDFWDARRLLKDLAVVQRNFGKLICGDTYPTQVVGEGLSRSGIRSIQRRLLKAVVSPPRHVIVRSMVLEGWFEFEPAAYYPGHWSKSLALFFTRRRLPLQQGALSNPYQTVALSWVGEKIRVERIQRRTKHEEIIRTTREAKRALAVPSCF